MKKENKMLSFINHYFTFFLLVAFVFTCGLTLFTTLLAESLGVELTNQNVNTAARITFWNVILISLIFTVIDAVRRRLTVDKEVERIATATKSISQGNFDVRLAPASRIASYEKFDEIVESINKMAEELGSVEELRSDFIANVSHEMKTPLAVMQNYATLLESKDLAEDKRIEYARCITDASKKLSDMMTNVLKLNRLEHQQIYPQKQNYNVGEQLCECLLQHERVWEKKEIEIETDIEEDVFIEEDKELLSLVWNNLLSNAFKFTPSGGKVFITLKKQDGNAVVKITDTGIGMTPEVGAHIFEKFYQGDRSRATQGNGLGLALVKCVMDVVKGEIGVDSTVGEGTTFTVKLKSK